MALRTASAVVMLLSSILAGVATTAHAAPDTQAACASLAGAMQDAGVVSANWQKAGLLDVPGLQGHASFNLPAHCLVRGVIAPRIGVDSRSYGIGFEMRLPQQWTGRLLYQGGAGLDGSIRPAIGAVGDGPPALARGDAVLATDGGHEGADASFASDQQARLDFAYASIGKAVAMAKRAVRTLYGHAQRYAYFDGCSNGGREAMMAADRFPLEFDGIVAGDPGFRLSHAAVDEAWNSQHFAAISPRGADGRPDLAKALSDADLKLVADLVRTSCDGLDGLRDGLVQNVAACHVELTRLQCRAGQHEGCLAAPKIAALDAMFSGPRDRHGQPFYTGFPIDTGIATPGWRLWTLGTPGGLPALNLTLGGDSLTRYFMTPARPGADVLTLDVDAALAAISQTGAIGDATLTQLSSFAGHGGKLLIYHGVSDPVFSSMDTVLWYHDLLAEDPRAASYARLFLIPGMTHCAGGIATDRFDPLQAIEDWVEHGTAPTRILATGQSLPGITRPLCAYPAYARYRGGPTQDAASFACTAPPG